MGPGWTLLRDAQLNSDYARLSTDGNDDNIPADAACILVDTGAGEAYEICSIGFSSKNDKYMCLFIY